MCLSDLIDLPVERVPAVIAATWRDFYNLSPTAAASPSLSPEREVAVVGGLDTESAA